VKRVPDAQGAVSRPAIDVSTAPSYAFGNRGVVWWGTLGMIALEGVMFAMLITAYLYLRTRNTDWPPGVLPPALFWGTLNLSLMLLSGIPNHFMRRAAEKLDLRGVQVWLAGCLVFGASFLMVRYFEFRTLNVWWDSNAYGSIVWLLLGFHTFHIATDFFETLVLGVMTILGPMSESRFVDISEDGIYWYFVVSSWVPVYVLIYLAPRYF
jgi:cytochrome c oxidase subunit III